MSSFRSAASSFITTTRKHVLQRDSLKDQFVPSKLDNNLIMRCGGASECQNFDGNILDVYSCQDAELIASPEQKSEKILYLDNNSSPELPKQRNPFVKRVSDLTTSPSLLSSGNCRQRGRNLMRIRRTIIDENNIVESRYFSKKNNEEHDIPKLENNFEDISSESTKYNVSADVNADIHNVHSTTIREELDFIENTISAESNDNTLCTNQDKSSINSFKYVDEKSYSDDRISEVSSTIQRTRINDCSSDNLLLSSSSNVKSVDDLIDHEKTSSLREDLRKWSSTKSCRATPRKRIENSKKYNTPNRVNINLHRRE